MKIPPKPKRPLNGYFRYMREVNSKVREENQGISNTLTVSIIAK